MFSAANVMFPVGDASAACRKTGTVAQASNGPEPAVLGYAGHSACRSGLKSSIDDGIRSPIQSVSGNRFDGSIATSPLSCERWNFAPTFATIGLFTTGQPSLIFVSASAASSSVALSHWPASGSSAVAPTCGQPSLIAPLPLSSVALSQSAPASAVYVLPSVMVSGPTEAESDVFSSV